jgi:hypothetical protein
MHTTALTSLRNPEYGKIPDLENDIQTYLSELKKDEIKENRKLKNKYYKQSQDDKYYDFFEKQIGMDKSKILQNKPKNSKLYT